MHSGLVLVEQYPFEVRVEHKNTAHILNVDYYNDPDNNVPIYLKPNKHYAFHICNETPHPLFIETPQRFKVFPTGTEAILDGLLIFCTVDIAVGRMFFLSSTVTSGLRQIIISDTIESQTVGTYQTEKGRGEFIAQGSI